MRKIFITLMAFLSIGTSAQEVSMRDVFKQMPDSIVPYLTENNRLDFIDFMDSNMNAEITNLLGGKSQMTKLNNLYVSLTLNEASSMEMRLLPLEEELVDGANQIICLIRTYGTDVRESVIDFFSLQWRRLATSDYLIWPKDNMFVASLNDENPSLTLVPVYKLDAPANEEQKELAKTSTTLKWKNKYLNEY